MNHLRESLDFSCFHFIQLLQYIIVIIILRGQRFLRMDEKNTQKNIPGVIKRV